MRLLVFLLVTALSLPAESRDALLNRIAITPAGQPAKVELMNKQKFVGRVLAVRTDAVVLLTPVNGVMTEREVALSEIRRFKKASESELGKFGTSALQALGATLGVIGGIVLFVALVSWAG